MIFWFLPSFLLIYPQLNIYLSLFVVWFPTPLSPSSIIQFPSPHDDWSVQNYPNNPIVTGCMLCIVVPNTAYTFLAFHSCHVFSPHVISIQPLDLTPHSSYQLLSNVMYIVILFWLATFWLIVVYNIIALTYVHQHYGTHFFEHSARNDDHEPPFTWHQRHKTIANNKERSYDDKHAMGVLLVWVYYYCLTLFVSTIVVL